MGPKKKGEEIGNKAKKKMENKIIEDKTFGLKNKNKSKVVQNYVKSVENQVKHGQERGGAQKREAEAHEAKKKKKSDEAAAALLASLFKNAQNLKKKGGAGAADVDDKKIDFYKDPREGTDDMPKDTIITCQFFLDAVEDEKYGWRWECPNGPKCGYRHQLPEGYILIPKKERDAQKKAQELLDEQQNKKTLEEQIEEERAALKSDGLTPVNKETFFAWKERRKKRKQAELEEKMKQEELAKAMGKKKGPGGGKNSIMNGRALFTYDPSLFKDADDGLDENPIKGKDEEEKEQEEDGGQIKEKQEAPQVDESLFQGENGEDEDVDFD